MYLGYIYYSDFQRFTAVHQSLYTKDTALKTSFWFIRYSLLRRIVRSRFPWCNCTILFFSFPATFTRQLWILPCDVLAKDIYNRMKLYVQKKYYMCNRREKETLGLECSIFALSFHCHYWYDINKKELTLSHVSVNA